jgi:2',3'-cyclic-nucleotide 2'-phosphodiesterase (5'-nucleotidase family)
MRLLGTLAIIVSAAIPLRILHFNDFHGHLLAESGQDISANALKFYDDIQRLRDQNSLLLSAGDTYFGSVESMVLKGEPVGRFINLLSLDAMAVGNHEFDLGIKRYTELAKASHYPHLAANISGLPFVKPYERKVVSSVRILIVGAITDSTGILTNVEPVFKNKIKISEPVAAIQKVLTQQRGSYDLAIALTHIGNLEDERLAKTITEPMIIVGGHSHTKMEAALKVGESWVVQAFQNGQVLGVTDIDWVDGKIESVKYNPVWVHRNEAHESVTSAVRAKTGEQKPDDRRAKIRKILDTTGKKMKEAVGQMVAESTLYLDGSRELVRTRETALGNLIADAFRSCTKTEVAIVNGGGIRSHLQKGKIAINDIISILPFENGVQSFMVTLSELDQILEISVAELPEQSGIFPQISGAIFELDAAQPSMQRISKLAVNGKSSSLETVSMTLTEYHSQVPAIEKIVSDNKRLAGCPGKTMWQIVSDDFKLRKKVEKVELGRIVLAEEK